MNKALFNDGKGEKYSSAQSIERNKNTKRNKKLKKRAIEDEVELEKEEPNLSINEKKHIASSRNKKQKCRQKP